MMIAIDLFSGSGGMSLGVESSGIRIVQSVEKDPYACQTFRRNFPEVDLFEGDIRDYSPAGLPSRDSLVFGGPPCQGFSTSNQRTRNRTNPENWMFKEFFRVVEEAGPEWVVFENVKGLLETERGFFLRLIVERLETLGYTSSFAPLNAFDFGVPQARTRLFVVGNRRGKKFAFPCPRRTKKVTVAEAIFDLPQVGNGAAISWLEYGDIEPSVYAQKLRSPEGGCHNNLVTKSASYIVERYGFVPQGGNWGNIPVELMANYKDRSRCHTGIYHRLDPNSPSVVLGNFRKNMLIHPVIDRGLSVREAARIQSFPDDFVFMGSIGFQQQQVGNAVPPLLAKEIFSKLVNG